MGAGTCQELLYYFRLGGTGAGVNTIVIQQPSELSCSVGKLNDRVLLPDTMEIIFPRSQPIQED